MRRLALIGIVVIWVVGLAVITSGLNTHSHVYTVRAIFDDASLAGAGEDVRIAGANVGSIQSLGVTIDKKAAVTLSITAPGFTPFHADATCAIRPASLIGEEYVDCNPGTSSTPRCRGSPTARARAAICFPSRAPARRSTRTSSRTSPPSRSASRWR